MDRAGNDEEDDLRCKRTPAQGQVVDLAAKILALNLVFADIVISVAATGEHDDREEAIGNP